MIRLIIHFKKQTNWAISNRVANYRMNDKIHEESIVIDSCKRPYLKTTVLDCIMPPLPAHC